MTAQGIAKTLAYKKQTGLGSPATGAGGQLLRRRTANFNLTRETYENDEIVSHQQSTGATAGMKRVAGNLDGLLSPKTYSDFFAAALRKVFVAGVSATAMSVTIAAVSTNFTVTRAAGSWLADGFKVGDVVRLSAGALNAANIAKNLVIIGLTLTVMTVRPVNGVALVPEGPITGTTATVIGKKTQLTINGGINQGEAEAGSNVGTDVQRGRIAVSGSFTAKFRDSDLQQLYDDQTPTNLILVLPVDASPNAAFITLVLPKLKLFGDAADDGEKEIIRTYPFTAEINGAGGPLLASDQTILSHQDSEV